MGMEVAGPERDIIVIGASAGGVEALTQLCSRLPDSLNASVFIVLHTAPTSPGFLPLILQRYTSLPALFPKNGQAIERGKIYIAPPNRHLLIHPGRMELSSGPRENLLRPAADALFRSAAEAYGARVVGVVLTGTRNDGTIGLQLIKQAGGVAIVQDPQEAMFASMPASALHSLNVDYVLGVAEIANVLRTLSGTKAETQHVAQHPEVRKALGSMFGPPEHAQESKKTPSPTGKKAASQPGAATQKENKKHQAERDNGLSSDQKLPEDRVELQSEAPMSERENPEESFTPDPLVRKNEEKYETGGTPDGSTPLTCPECGGTLWEIKEGKLSLYVCHVGHRFSESSLLAGIADTLEEALWVAVRALEERAFFCRRLANRSEASGRAHAAKTFNEQADEASQKARLIRSIIMSGKVTSSDEESEEGIS